MSTSKLEALLDYIDLRASQPEQTSWRTSHELATTVKDLFATFDEPLPMPWISIRVQSMNESRFLVMDMADTPGNVRLIVSDSTVKDRVLTFLVRNARAAVDLDTGREYYMCLLDKEEHKARCVMRGIIYNGTFRGEWPNEIQFPPFKNKLGSTFIRLIDGDFEVTGHI